MPEPVSPLSDPPAYALAALERELEAVVVEFDLACQAYRMAPSGVPAWESQKAMEAAAVRVNELHEEIAEAPAETLADAAVKLRRIDAALEDESLRVRKLLRKMVLALNVIAMSSALAALTACETVNIDPIPGDKIGMVLMHGKGGTTNHVEFLRSKLESAGILVEMPLMPWSRDRIYDKGYEESMEEIDTYVVRLKAAGAKRIFVAGHSIGANAALGYAARREGLSGAILLAYGHVPGLGGFALRLSKSVAKARAMIDVGKGDETAVFWDYGGGNDTATSTANDLLSWFDPNGPATIANNAPKVKPNTPVLCVDGSSDKWKRCRKMTWLLPKNSRNRKVTVNAGHLGTPSAAVEQIANWLRALEEPIPKHEGPRPECVREPGRIRAINCPN